MLGFRERLIRRLAGRQVVVLANVHLGYDERNHMVIASNGHTRGGMVIHRAKLPLSARVCVAGYDDPIPVSEASR